MACGDHKHPLSRGGTSQPQRQAPPLKPGYVQVDEKGMAEWIVYAEALAAYVQYWRQKKETDPPADPDPLTDGNWQPFFSQEISTALASVAVQEITALDGIAERFEILRADANQADPDLLKETLASLFGAALTFSRALDKIDERLPDEATLKTAIAGQIQTSLASALKRLLSYYKAADSAGLLIETDIPDWKILGLAVTKPATLIAEGLSERWITTSAADWSIYFNDITADPSIFGPSAADEQKIRYAANHNLFSSVFDQYLAAYARILKEAQANLAATLENWPKHNPHIALFLAFLKLFRSVRDELNKITARHLDFYYLDVLRLRPRDPQSDSAHVVIELAKTVSDTMLPAGTLFKGGKDSAGQEILYGLDKDSVFNRAKLSQRMAVYLGSVGDDIVPVVNDQRLFAASVIDSADGLGAKLESEFGEWHPFVNRTYVDGKLQSVDLPRAQIGFAVASHYLAMAEGERRFTLRLSTSANATVQAANWDVFVTSPKGWTQIVSPSKSVGVLEDGLTAAVEIACLLDELQPAITDYNAEIHGGALGVALPVAKVLLRNTPDQSYGYAALRDLTVSQVEVVVDVGNATASTHTGKGVRQLVMSNALGPVDPAKPFLPFGPQPVADDLFIIGSKEVFSKRGAQIRFDAEWAKLPSDPSDIDFDGTGEYYPFTTLQTLSGGTWKNLATNVVPFDEVTSLVTFPESLQTIPAEASVSYEDAYSSFSNQAANGFLRLKLTGTFGHKEYLEALTTYLIGQSKDPPTGTKPTEPYTPTLLSFSIRYRASTSSDLNSELETDFEGRSLQFFHLYPFGHAEQHRALTGTSDPYLLPQFRHVEPALDPTQSATALENIGELYLGFEELTPGQGLSLLFQVLDGSSDPLVLKPEEHLYFDYLSNNEWKAIPRNEVSDATNELVQSGLVELAIPEDAGLPSTLLPSGYVWLRLSVAEAADAVCKLLDILPQAARVTCQPGPLNATDLFNAPRPAGSISKLKTPLSAVKKVQQPFSSFNGRPLESSAAFYTRVSERLRHKDRAITIWDYERLVLEAFPQIHKVKCLSHTKVVPDPDDPLKTVYSELAPGYVTVITIPDLKARNDANPLRPYTSAAILSQVQEFLRARTTCHATVIAANPLFEEMRLEFTATLREGYNDAVFYRKLLQDEITQFLTPWAFGGTTDIQFGGKVYKSALIDFVEERPYIDFLVDVKLFHKPGDTAPESGDLEEVVASTARSILVSAPATSHNITVELHQDSPGITEECTDHE